MNTHRKTAIMVGVLYIIGTVAGVLSVVVTTPILGDADYLSKVAANPNQIVAGALLVLTMGFALALVPVLLFPIFKKYNEVLAIGYVVFRGALETVAYIVSVIPWLFLIILSQEYVAAGTPAASYFQTLAAILLKGNDSISAIIGTVFCLGALILYYVLYRSQLVPRWISIWGFIAILLNLTTCILILLNLQTPFSMINSLMNSPIFLQEMVMAVWLIVKGFNPAAIASLSARVDLN